MSENHFSQPKMTLTGRICLNAMSIVQLDLCLSSMKWTHYVLPLDTMTTSDLR